MANPIHFGSGSGDSGNDRKRTTPPPACAACEEMLADALDGTLGAVDQAWFDRHIDTCSTCAEGLAEAQRGAAWLEMLKSPRPEPRPELLMAILAHVDRASQDQAQAGQREVVPSHSAPGQVPELVPVQAPAARPFLVQPPAYPVPAASLPSNVIPMRARGPAMMRFGRFEIESRLAMTAAMAFFSVAVTLNLAGIRLNELKASSLTPASIRHSFYETNARVVRYYDNLRVVQVVEARVDTLRTGQDDASRVGESFGSGDAPSGKAQFGRPDSGKPQSGRPESERPRSAKPGSGQPDEKAPGPGSRIEPLPVLPADPVSNLVSNLVSDSRSGASSLFVNPAWLRVNAGDLV